MKNNIPRDRIWPESEHPCIWMDVGIIDYKLCNRNYDCENCYFDVMIHNGVLDLNEYSGSNTYSTGNIKYPKSQLKKSSDGKAAKINVYDYLTIDDTSYYGDCFWVIKPTEKNVLSVGVMQLAQRLLPAVKDIILPQNSTQIIKDKIISWIITTDGTIRLASPVNGEVIETNTNLATMLNRKHQNGSDFTWFFKCHVNDATEELEGYYRGQNAKEFLLIQHKKVVQAFESAITHLSEQLGQTIQDGGVPLYRLDKILGSQKYFEII